MAANQIQMLLVVVSLISGDHFIPLTATLSDHHADDIFAADKLKKYSYINTVPIRPTSTTDTCTATAESVTIAYISLNVSIPRKNPYIWSYTFLLDLLRRDTIFGPDDDEFFEKVEFQSLPTPIIMGPEDQFDPLFEARRTLSKQGYSVIALFLEPNHLLWFLKQNLGGLTIFAPNDNTMSHYNISTLRQFADVFPAYVVPHKLLWSDLSRVRSGTLFLTFFQEYDILLKKMVLDERYFHELEEGEYYPGRLKVNGVSIERPDLFAIKDWLVVHGIAELMMEPGRFSQLLFNLQDRSDLMTELQSRQEIWNPDCRHKFEEEGLM